MICKSSAGNPFKTKAMQLILPQFWHPYKQIPAADAGYFPKSLTFNGKGTEMIKLCLKKKIQRHLHHSLLCLKWVFGGKLPIYLTIKIRPWSDFWWHASSVWSEIGFTRLDSSTMLECLHAQLPFSLTYFALLHLHESLTGSQLWTACW